MPLKVIGAGLGRTGTMSLKHALERLGFGPCHHMTDLARVPARWPLWERAFDGEPVDWEEIFQGFNSTVDMPASFFYDELAARYPEANVILTVRDPDKWFESSRATMLADDYREKLNRSPIGNLMAKMWAFQARKYGGPKVPPTALSPAALREAAIARFNAHNAQVRQKIPAERLLVFEAVQGWAPLCRFLGVPAPDVPFPHLNEPGKWQSILPIVTNM